MQLKIVLPSKNDLKLHLLPVLMSLPLNHLPYFSEQLDFDFGSETFSNPIFQKVLQNFPSFRIISVPGCFAQLCFLVKNWVQNTSLASRRRRGGPVHAAKRPKTPGRRGELVRFSRILVLSSRKWCQYEVSITLAKKATTGPPVPIQDQAHPQSCL